MRENNTSVPATQMCEGDDLPVPKSPPKRVRSLAYLRFIVQCVTIELTKKLNVFGTACLTSCYNEVLSHYTLRLILNE